MSIVAIDIETAPLPAAITGEVYPADERQPPANYKSAEAIAKWRARDEAQWHDALLKDAALSPRTGRIVAVGFAWRGVTGSDWSAGEDEREVIEHAIRYLYDNDLVVTYNGTSFDLPFLATRAAILGVPLRMNFGRLMRRYSTSPHCDVRGVLTQWDSRAKGTLAQWLAAFGLPPKTGSGADVAALAAAGEWDAIGRYAADDAVRTLALYDRIAPYFL